VAVGVVAYGLVWAPTCYLRASHYHRLDLAILLAVLAELARDALGARTLANVSLRPFRVLRLFQPLIALHAFAPVRRVLATLRAGAVQAPPLPTVAPTHVPTVQSLC
jgi:hypothetical protein